MGLETLPRRTSGVPAIRLSFAVVVSTSAGGLAGAPGAPLGQSGRVRCPGAGCHAGCWATRLMEDAAKAAQKKSAYLSCFRLLMKNRSDDRRRGGGAQMIRRLSVVGGHYEDRLQGRRCAESAVERLLQVDAAAKRQALLHRLRRKHLVDEPLLGRHSTASASRSSIVREKSDGQQEVARRKRRYFMRLRVLKATRLSVFCAELRREPESPSDAAERANANGEELRYLLDARLPLPLIENDASKSGNGWVAQIDESFEHVERVAEAALHVRIHARHQQRVGADAGRDGEVPPALWRRWFAGKRCGRRGPPPAWHVRRARTAFTGYRPKTEILRQRVGGSQRAQHRERRLSRPGLQNFVDGAVAAAGEDRVVTLPHGGLRQGLGAAGRMRFESVGLDAGFSSTASEFRTKDARRAEYCPEAGL